MHFIKFILAILLLTACDVGTLRVLPAEEWDAATSDTTVTVETFREVSEAIGSEARAECLRKGTTPNCNFRILVDLNPRAPANAFQTLDENNQPVIVFTRQMIRSAQNADELAFVMGHEAAHHVLGHIARQTKNANLTAENFGKLARLHGWDEEEIAQAQKLGAEVGKQAYAKDFELEADQMGTVITYNAGYNPLIGAKYFDRIPDPGDRFLGSHPPNAARVQIVLETANKLGLAQ